jgi:hypothetical protein
MKDQLLHNREGLTKVFKLISRHLHPSFNSGKLIIFADSQNWQLYPDICTCTADYFENSYLHSNKQALCLVRGALKLSFGAEILLSWRFLDYQLYFQNIILTAQGDEIERWEARQYLEDQAVGTLAGIFWIMKGISPTCYVGS